MARRAIGRARGRFLAVLAAVAVMAILGASPALAVDPIAGPAAADFADVPGEHPFVEAISWAVDEGIASGYADGDFHPSAPVSRQAMAAFLFRLAGEPEIVYLGPPTFSDVGPGHPFYDAIQWAALEGIASGYPDGSFDPSGEVSRQAMSAFVYRSLGSPPSGSDAAPSFPDVPESHPFFASISWMAGSGLIDGYEDGLFRPSATTSRQAAVAVLYRVSQLPL